LNISNSHKKLSFVVPFTLEESIGDVSRWRQEVNNDSAHRFRLLISSFLAMFDQNDLCEFLIVCPAKHVDAIRRLMAGVTTDDRYVVLAESVVVPKIGAVLRADVDGMGGWYAQQVIKLAAHELVKTKYYLVLDSDIVCIRPCGYDSFVVGERCLLNIETSADYSRLYRPDFIQQEKKFKRDRFASSSRVVNQNFVEGGMDRFYGETPVVLSTSHVRLLIQALERQHRADWVDALAKFQRWTEYGLYFGFLESQNILEKVYKEADCNAILSLEKSVWHESHHYLVPREYNQAHFFGEKAGYFAAIQSWIPEAHWLPSRYASKTEFYRDMEKWVAAAAEKNISQTVRHDQPYPAKGAYG
jgi:hypothetical protein